MQNTAPVEKEEGNLKYINTALCPTNDKEYKTTVYLGKPNYFRNNDDDDEEDIIYGVKPAKDKKATYLKINLNTNQNVTDDRV